MRSILKSWIVVLALGGPLSAVEVNDYGIISIKGAEGTVEGDTFSHTFKSPRWGMYSVTFELEKGTEPKTETVEVELLLQGEKTTKSVTVPGNPLRLGQKAGHIPQAYIAKSGECGLKLTVPGYAAEISSVTLAPAPEGTAELTIEDGELVLPAHEATVWGRMLRYEPNPKKLCVGYWVNKNDYARWIGRIASPATYEVTIYQGCGKPHGGSNAEIRVSFGSYNKSLPFKVKETKGFQDFVPVKVGRVSLPSVESMKGIQAADPKLALEVRAVDIAHKAVMDIQKVVLKKVEE